YGDSMPIGGERKVSIASARSWRDRMPSETIPSTKPETTASPYSKARSAARWSGSTTTLRSCTDSGLPSTEMVAPSNVARMRRRIAREHLGPAHHLGGRSRGERRLPPPAWPRQLDRDGGVHRHRRAGRWRGCDAPRDAAGAPRRAAHARRVLGHGAAEQG